MKEVKIHQRCGLDGLPICGQHGAKEVMHLTYYSGTNNAVTYLRQHRLTPDALCKKCFAVGFISEQYEKADGEI